MKNPGMKKTKTVYELDNRSKDSITFYQEDGTVIMTLPLIAGGTSHFDRCQIAKNPNVDIDRWHHYSICGSSMAMKQSDDVMYEIDLDTGILGNPLELKGVSKINQFKEKETFQGMKKKNSETWKTLESLGDESEKEKQSRKETNEILIRVAKIKFPFLKKEFENLNKCSNDTITFYGKDGNVITSIHGWDNYSIHGKDHKEPEVRIEDTEEILYEILQDITDPHGFVAKGTRKTNFQWLARFSMLTHLSFDEKTDWFKRIDERLFNAEEVKKFAAHYSLKQVSSVETKLEDYFIEFFKDKE